MMFKKSAVALVLSVLGSAVVAQTPAGVPPDYIPAGITPLDAQIDAVRRNYEDVQSKAQAEMAARQAAAAKAQAKKDAAAQAAAKERAKKAAKVEKRQDEAAELDLELKRLKVREQKSQVELGETMNDAKAKRAGDLVDSVVERERAGVERIRTESKAIEMGAQAGLQSTQAPATVPESVKAPAPEPQTTKKSSWWPF